MKGTRISENTVYAGVVNEKIRASELLNIPRKHNACASVED